MNTRLSEHGTGLFLLGLMLAIGIFFSTLVLSGTIKKVKLNAQGIVVKGYAERNISSDLGMWNGNVTTRSIDLVSAYNKLQSDVNMAVEYLVRKGVRREDIEIGSVNTIRQYALTPQGTPTNTLEGYELNQNIQVTSKNVRQIQDISNEITSLIQQGVEIISFPPQYYYSKINDLKIKMLGEATKDAYMRAEQLAENAKSSVGSLRSASQGVFQITSPNSTEVADYGMYDLSTIEKSIKAVVTVEFNVD